MLHGAFQFWIVSVRVREIRVGEILSNMVAGFGGLVGDVALALKLVGIPE